MSIRYRIAAAALVTFAVHTPLAAQHRIAPPAPSSAHGAALLAATARPTVARTGASPRSKRRLKHAVIGGAIGVAAGIAVCTLIATEVDDSAHRDGATCTTTGYMLFSGIGLVLGAGIGALIR